MSEHNPMTYGGPDFTQVCNADGLPWPCPDAVAAGEVGDAPTPTDGGDPTPAATDAPVDPGQPSQDALGGDATGPVDEAPPADPSSPDAAVPSDQGA